MWIRQKSWLVEGYRHQLVVPAWSNADKLDDFGFLYIFLEFQYTDFPWFKDRIYLDYQNSGQKLVLLILKIIREVAQYQLIITGKHIQQLSPNLTLRIGQSQPPLAEGTRGRLFDINSIVP